MSVVVVSHYLDSILRNSYMSSVGLTAEENGRHCNVLRLMKRYSVYINIYIKVPLLFCIILYYFNKCFTILHEKRRVCLI